MDQDATNAPAQLQTPQKWAERGVGQKWQHRFFHRLIRLLGRRPAYHMVGLVTFWYVLFRPSIRRRTRYYLDRRFPQRRGALARFADSWRLMRSFGNSLVDLASLRILGPETFAITSPDHDRLVGLCESPRGFVLLHAHVGCWQVGLSALGHLRKPISLVMVPDANLQAQLSEYPLTVIDPRRGLEAVIEMMAVLERGEILCLMGDRMLGEQQNTVKVQFLGGPVALPVSAYRLASAAKVPVVVLTAPKTGFGSYELRLASVIDVPAGLGRQVADYAPYARQFVQCMEQFLQQHPWQYYNFYDLWAA